ncbi:hypothetical protein [Mycolicibacterium sp. GESEQ-9]|uniref:hypothetical protein n=1 Tax=Mycolicibacterium sp. GESEQ-9 TaxID=2812656 RepID=UPI001B3260BC|nr:hypothetical protein [Mycolicibacterium sp. GESEQ-9]
MATTIERITHVAQIRRARARLDRIEEMRAAEELRKLGKSQREIAELLIVTQPRVGRLLRGAETLGDAPTPEELILRATVEGAPRDLLVRELRAYPYTFTEYAPAPHEGSVPGTWSQVNTAHKLGLLSVEEYENIRVAVRPPTLVTGSMP